MEPQPTPMIPVLGVYVSPGCTPEEVAELISALADPLIDGYTREEWASVGVSDP